jgi:hypothetical protein
MLVEYTLLAQQTDGAPSQPSDLDNSSDEVGEVNEER